jgi:O-antigen/teichoic acid export membrane protein
VSIYGGDVIRSLSLNIVSAGFARFWQAGLQLLLTPIIVHLLGPVAYGLVGFYAALTLFLAFLDQAVSPVLMRELGRSASRPDAADQLRSLLRTSAVFSTGTAAGLGLLIVLGAPLIARNWLVNSGLPDSELINSIRLMGLSLACQWPSSVYGAALVGLQRQDLLMLVRVAFATAQSVGAVVLLAKVSASPEVFFGWMAVTSAMLSVALCIVLWRIMPKSDAPPKVDIRIMKGTWRFAVGNVAIGLTTALLTQSSSLIIAKYCSLDQLAAYTLAVNLAGQVATILSQPVSTTLMPHFAHLIARRDEVHLAREYHRWTQIIVVLVLPMAGTFAVFARPVLQLWLGVSSPLIEPVSALLPWVTIGTLFNCVMVTPYLLQIASGWTRLCVATNIVALVVLLPTLFFVVPRYGPMAAAICWIGLNVGYYLIMVPCMHARLLPRELFSWWLQDTFFPVAVVGTIYAAVWALIPSDIPRLTGVALSVMVALVAWGALLAILPTVRADAFGFIRLLKLQVFRAS